MQLIYENFFAADFLCKDRRSCVSRSLVCDGRSHCYDGSDEADCQTVTAPPLKPNVLKCRLGSRPCHNGKECVLFSHVCDGEIDCMDGSDEEGCRETCKEGWHLLPALELESNSSWSFLIVHHL